MVLTEEGEADFYYLARNTSQPLVIPTKAQGFPMPPTFAPGTPQETGMQGNMVEGITIPTSAAREAAAGNSSSVGSLTTMPLSIPVGMSMGGSVGGAESSLPGSFTSSPANWGSPQWGDFDGMGGQARSPRGSTGGTAAGYGGGQMAAPQFGAGGGQQFGDGGGQAGGFGGFAGGQPQQFGGQQQFGGGGGGGDGGFGGHDADDMEL